MMISTMHMYQKIKSVYLRQNGFVALIAVLMLAFGSMAYSLSVLGSAEAYADMVDRRESRIQAGMNAQSCLDVVTLMSTKDYFLAGIVSVPEFGCKASVSRYVSGSIFITAEATLNGISSPISSVTYQG